MNLGLKNKNVFITGASKGIGFEIAKQLALEGCRIHLVARDKKKLKLSIQNLRGKKALHSYTSVDLVKKGGPKKAVSEAIKNMGSIDIVIHNLGGGLGKSNVLSKIDDWNKVLRFNAGIAIELNNLIVPKMQKSKWGRIVHVSSLNAVTGGTSSKGGAFAPEYSCAKSYLNMYTKVLGRELAKDNIIVSAVMPGVILTKGKYWEKLKKTKPKLVKSYIKNHQSVERLGDPSEIAPFVLLLCSDKASYAASSIISIDGGYF